MSELEAGSPAMKGKSCLDKVSDFQRWVKTDPRGRYVVYAWFWYKFIVATISIAGIVKLADGESACLPLILVEADNGHIDGFLDVATLSYAVAFICWFLLALGHLTMSPPASLCSDKCYRKCGSKDMPGPGFIKNPIVCAGAPENILGLAFRSTAANEPAGSGECCSHGYFGACSKDFRAIYDKDDDVQTNVAIMEQTIFHIRAIGWFQALTLQLTAMCLASYYIATCGDNGDLVTLAFFSSLDLVTALADLLYYVHTTLNARENTTPLDESLGKYAKRITQIFNLKKRNWARGIVALCLVLAIVIPAHPSMFHDADRSLDVGIFTLAVSGTPAGDSCEWFAGPASGGTSLQGLPATGAASLTPSAAAQPRRVAGCAPVCKQPQRCYYTEQCKDAVSGLRGPYGKYSFYNIQDTWNGETQSWEEYACSATKDCDDCMNAACETAAEIAAKDKEAAKVSGYDDKGANYCDGQRTEFSGSFPSLQSCFDACSGESRCHTLNYYSGSNEDYYSGSNAECYWCPAEGWSSSSSSGVMFQKGAKLLAAEATAAAEAEAAAKAAAAKAVFEASRKPLEPASTACADSLVSKCKSTKAFSVLAIFSLFAALVLLFVPKVSNPRAAKATLFAAFCHAIVIGLAVWVFTGDAAGEDEMCGLAASSDPPAGITQEQALQKMLGSHCATVVDSRYCSANTGCVWLSQHQMCAESEMVAELQNGGRTFEFGATFYITCVNFVLCLVALKFISDGALTDPEPVVKGQCDMCGKDVTDRQPHMKKGGRYYLTACVEEYAANNSGDAAKKPAKAKPAKKATPAPAATEEEEGFGFGDASDSD